MTTQEALVELTAALERISDVSKTALSAYDREHELIGIALIGEVAREALTKVRSGS